MNLENNIYDFMIDDLGFDLKFIYNSRTIKKNIDDINEKLILCLNKFKNENILNVYVLFSQFYHQSPIEFLNYLEDETFKNLILNEIEILKRNK